MATLVKYTDNSSGAKLPCEYAQSRCHEPNTRLQIARADEPKSKRQDAHRVVLDLHQLLSMVKTLRED